MILHCGECDVSFDTDHDLESHRYHNGVNGLPLQQGSGSIYYNKYKIRYVDPDVDQGEEIEVVYCVLDLNGFYYEVDSVKYDINHCEEWQGPFFWQNSGIRDMLDEIIMTEEGDADEGTTQAFANSSVLPMHVASQRFREYLRRMLA